MPVDAEKVNILIQQIYDAALDDTLWPSIIRKISRLIKASDSILYSPRLDDKSDPFTLSPFEHASRDVWTDYASYYWQHDVWLNESIKQNLTKTGMVIHGDQLIDRNTFRKTVVYNDYLIPKMGGVEVVMGAVVCDASIPEQLPPMYLCLYNNGFAEAFAKQDEDMIRYLLPHLHRALRVRWKITHVQQISQLREHALNSIGSAILLLDATGRILFANQKAEILIRQCTNPKVLNGRLFSQDVIKNNEIKQAVRQAQAGYGSTLRFDGGSKEGLRVLTFSPISAISSDSLSTQARIIVIITEPNIADVGDLTAFAKLYGLTSAETRVLKQLLQPQTTKEIAEALHISMPTLRTQLSALFAKTNTKNQRELIRYCLAHPMIR